MEPSIVHRIERPTMGSKLVQRSIIHGRHHLRSLILRQSERPGLLRAWQHLISEDGEFDRQGLRFLRLADGEFRGMADRLIHEEELNMQVLLVLLLQAKGEIFYLIIQIDPTSLHLAILVIDDHQEVGILQGRTHTHLVVLTIRQRDVLDILLPQRGKDRRTFFILMVEHHLVGGGDFPAFLVSSLQVHLIGAGSPFAGILLQRENTRRIRLYTAGADRNIIPQHLV